jgi:hypothetical protein
MEYRDIESILAELHGVTPDDRVGAFRSRLRVLRDMGVPAVEKPGKGSRVTYKFLDLWEMHLALLLERFGLPPASVKFVVEDRLGWLRWYDAMREREKQTTGSPPSDIWVHMRYFSRNLEDGIPAPVTLIEPLDKIVFEIKSMDEKAQTAVIGLINLSKLTRECESAILKHVK